MTRNIWTPEQEAQLVALKKRGYSVGMIGHEMGLTEGQVTDKVTRLRYKGVLDRPPVNHVWSDEDHAELIQMHDEGASRSEMAMRLGRTISSIDARLKRSPEKDVRARREAMKVARLKSNPPDSDRLNATLTRWTADRMPLEVFKWLQKITPEGAGLSDTIASIITDAYHDEMENDITKETESKSTIRRIAELEAALKPFAQEAVFWQDQGYHVNDYPVEGFPGYDGIMTCGDLYHATKIMEKTP